MKAERRMIRFGDGVVYAVLVLLCAALFLLPLLQNRNGTLLAELLVDGEPAEEFVLSALSQPVTRRVHGCEILFSRDGVRFVSANCPDRLCVNTGEIRIAGESIACVPNRVVVVLRQAQGDADYDVVAY